MMHLLFALLVTAQRSPTGVGPRWPAPAALPGSFATSSDHLLNCTSRMPVSPGVKIDKHKLERDMLIKPCKYRNAGAVMNEPNEIASASLGEKPTLVEAAQAPIDIGLPEDVHPPSIDPTGLSNGRLVIFALSQLVLWAAHVSASSLHATSAQVEQAAIILEVSFSLPVIQEDFEISEADVQWVIASYMLTWVRRARKRSFSHHVGLLSTHRRQTM